MDQKTYTTPVCGVVQSAYDIRDYRICAASELPEEFKTNKVPVKNQGSTGSCVAHALSTVVEYHHTKLTKSRKTFSTEFIYGYRDDGYYIGIGMCIRDALKTLTKYGDPFTSDCKGNNEYEAAMKNISENFDTLKDLAYPHRISAYVKLNNADEMKTSIMNNGPIVISMNMYADAKLVNNIYTYTNNKITGCHCVMIYGWNKDGWLVQNSWGTGYGDRGRFIIPYSFKFNEAWGIIDNIDDTEFEIIKPSENKFAKFCYKLLNKVINFVINILKKNK